MSRKDFRGPDSPINACMWDFAGYVAKVRPMIAMFESVQGAYKQGYKLMRALRAKVEYDTGQRWDLHHVLHNNASLGGASIRKRYFWLITRVPFGVERMPQVRMPTLMDVIGDLEPLGTTWEPQPYVRPPTWWAQREGLRSDAGVVDGMAVRRTPNIKRMIDLIEAGEEWEPKENLATVVRRFYERHGKLPDSWGEEKTQKIVERDFNMGFHQPIRWHPLKVARVATGGVMDMVMHPTLDRMISHRETARIQGFPDDWRIRPLRGASGLHMTWGKGIPVQAGRWISSWARESILGNPGSYTGDPPKNAEDREYVIDVTNDYRAICDER